MSYPRLFRVVRLLKFFVLLCYFLTSGKSTTAQATDAAAPAQEAPAKPEPPNMPGQVPPSDDKQEVSSHDAPTTFKVRVNLVLVRVVVRDAQGKVVSNLKKEDFQLQDSRKPQAISSFSVETPESHTASALASPDADAGYSSSADAIGGKATVLPRRFVSLVFDDVHLSMEDATFVRDSATRLFGALAASDRVAINTTSGQFSQDFTDDQELLKKALLGIIPRSMTARAFHDCPDVNYYEADLIVNKNEAQALAVAAEEAVQCAFGGNEQMLSQARTMAMVAAERAVSAGDAESQYAYRHIEDVARRLASMPGQRVLVFVSPGFLQTTIQSEASEMIDRATRANIVINTIDARGLYAPDVMGDIANPPQDTYRTAGYKTSYRVAQQTAQEDVLAQLADGTGGKFFHNRNDVDEAMRQAVAAPAFSYLLGFSPQNLKIDGRYHPLKVSLTNKEKYNIQARHGYYAPRSINDPAEATKEEMREALFSQEEIRDLPVELQTQFFRKDDAEARLAVLTRLDVKGMHFRKAEGRNNDSLTIVTGIFDENGNFVTGGEKTVQMRLLDTTYERLSHSGFTVKSSFDVKPGTYMVRLVVRDSEGAQMAARNGAVVIPY
jgi:VWFA-related protein